jgi:hypothetical protein
VVSAAWFAPRVVAAGLALAAAVAFLLFYGDRVMAIQPAGLLVLADSTRRLTPWGCETRSGTCPPPGRRSWPALWRLRRQVVV